MGKIEARLRGLLPELEYARETHRQWAEDASEKDRARNPDIGDAAFHHDMVRIYNMRIDTIKQAANELERLRKKLGDRDD